MDIEWKENNTKNITWVQQWTEHQIDGVFGVFSFFYYYFFLCFLFGGGGL